MATSNEEVERDVEVKNEEETQLMEMQENPQKSFKMLKIMSKSKHRI